MHNKVVNKVSSKGVQFSCIFCLYIYSFFQLDYQKTSMERSLQILKRHLNIVQVSAIRLYLCHITVKDQRCFLRLHYARGVIPSVPLWLTCLFSSRPMTDFTGVSGLRGHFLIRCYCPMGSRHGLLVKRARLGSGRFYGYWVGPAGDNRSRRLHRTLGPFDGH